jgi:glycosyltransferase involved in cell wall biosynthesis
VNVTVLVPVLNRPPRVLPLIRSVQDTSDAKVLFLCSPDDHAQIRECRRQAAKHRRVGFTIVPWPNGPGDYSRKVNHGIRITSEDWLLQGADDLVFRDGWLQAAETAHTATGGRVVGTNDLGNPRVMRGQHATHSLVRRDYVRDLGTWDQPGLLLHEGYGHNFCDDEMVLTARQRHEFVFAHDCHVEHLHPNWKKGVPDRTYEIGMERFRQDRALFNQRRHKFRRVR